MCSKIYDLITTYNYREKMGHGVMTRADEALHAREQANLADARSQFGSPTWARKSLPGGAMLLSKAIFPLHYQICSFAKLGKTISSKDTKHARTKISNCFTLLFSLSSFFF